jgi:hypothetical protein
MISSAVIWLAEKLRTEFGFAFSDNILEEAKEKETQNCQTAYELGLKQCSEQYQQAIQSAIINLDKPKKKTK